MMKCNYLPTGWCQESTLSYSSFVRCDNMPTFLDHLQQLIDSKPDWRDRTVFIVSHAHLFFFYVHVMVERCEVIVEVHCYVSHS